MSEKSREIHIEDSENTWANHRIYVLSEIERATAKEAHFAEQLVELKTEIATLRTKMAIYISIAAFISSTVVAITVKMFA